MVTQVANGLYSSQSYKSSSNPTNMPNVIACAQPEPYDWPMPGAHNKRDMVARAQPEPYDGPYRLAVVMIACEVACNLMMVFTDILFVGMRYVCFLPRPVQIDISR